MVAAALPVRGGSEERAQDLLYALVFAIVAALVLAPIAFLLVSSFQISTPGQPAVWSLSAWARAVGNADIWLAMWNSVRLYLAISVFSWPIALMLAWTIGRTDLPMKGTVEFLLWLSFFLPSLTVVMGWISLLDPGAGTINQLLRKLPWFKDALVGPLDIYTFWGIVWVHLGQDAIAIKTILLIPAFRNLDSYMEEASRLSGAGMFKTLRRIIIPLVGPAIIITALLGFVRLWQSFETELVLGTPQRFYVYGTKIYDLLHKPQPDYGQATVLAAMVIILTFPFMVLQQRFSAARSYETITGRARASATPLGRARLPVFAVVMALALIISILPMGSVIIATFMKVFGHFEIPQPWTLEHWTEVLNDRLFTQALRNTLLIAGSAALVSVLTCTLIAYILVRTQFRLRGALDVITWMPQALPGMLIGLGTVWIVLDWFKPLYGTLTLLIVVMVVSSLTVSVQITKSNMIQLGKELEEASRVSGASWFRTMRKVVMPPLTPVLMLVATFAFVAASRDVSNIILLASGPTSTLALLELDYIAASLWESATVVAVVMTVITTGVALIARAFNVRLGVR